jgi:hypothetical protein
MVGNAGTQFSGNLQSTCSNRCLIGSRKDAGTDFENFGLNNGAEWERVFAPVGPLLLFHEEPEAAAGHVAPLN